MAYIPNNSHITNKFVDTNQLIYYVYPMTDNMDNLKQALEDMKKGKPVFVYDADGREEETDIVYASEMVGRTSRSLVTIH